MRVSATACTLAAVLATAGLLAGCPAELPFGSETDEDGAPLGVVGGKLDGVELAAYGSIPSTAELDRPLSVLFAPDDPTVTLEVALIDGVRAAREADPGVFADGDNPYRIRYAVYNLRNVWITDALIAAADAGVDVQVLIESDQLSPARTWNLMDERLIAAGFEFAPDHRQLSTEARRSMDLVGIVDGGLMHLKARLFETPAGLTVYSGSMNPGDNAAMNEETLHLINDPRVAARYALAYDAVLDGRAIDNTWDDGAAVNVLFSPTAGGPRAGRRLLDWIAAEEEQILLMVFSLRDVWGELVNLLRAKVAAGVPVYVITDRKQSDGVDADGRQIYWNDGTDDRLRGAGVHVYEAINRRSPYTAVHPKAAVLGLTSIRVVSGAANFTGAGLGSTTRPARNYESLLFIDTEALDGGATGIRYLGQWLRVLERYAEQGAADGEPGFFDVYDALATQPTWPNVPVFFDAITFTNWGEQVWVRGDIEALGYWGWVSGGLPLSTDAASYPAWSNIEPAQIPLGLPFVWKLVAADAAGTRWEAGDDRVGMARLEPLEPGGLRLRAVWR